MSASGCTSSGPCGLGWYILGSGCKLIYWGDFSHFSNYSKHWNRTCSDTGKLWKTLASHFVITKQKEWLYMKTKYLLKSSRNMWVLYSWKYYIKIKQSKSALMFSLHSICLSCANGRGYESGKFFSAVSIFPQTSVYLGYKF